MLFRSLNDVQLLLLFMPRARAFACVENFSKPGFTNQSAMHSKGQLLRQGSRLRLVADATKKLSAGDQNFKTGRRQATNLLSPRHLKFQGERAFFKKKKT